MSKTTQTQEPRPVRFGEFTRQWEREYRLPDGSEPAGGTKRNLHVDIGHFLPFFEDMTMTEITPMDIKRWYDAPHPEGRWAFHRSCQRLKAIFRAATLMQLDGTPAVLRENPFILPVPPAPGADSDQVPPITPDELRRLYLAMPDYTRLGVLLSTLVGGLRCGEICALQVRDIDLDARRLHVRHSVNRGPEDRGDPQLGRTKTAASVRTVPIPDAMTHIIRLHLDTFCGRAPESQVFVPKRARLLSQTTFEAQFRRAREAAGRPDITTQTLRASHATLMMLRGATLREVMAQLGHTSEHVAIRHYQLLVSEHRNRIANRLADEFLTEEEPPARPDDLIRSLEREIEKLQAMIDDATTRGRK